MAYPQEALAYREWIQCPWTHETVRQIFLESVEKIQLHDELATSEMNVPKLTRPWSNTMSEAKSYKSLRMALVKKSLSRRSKRPCSEETALKIEAKEVVRRQNRTAKHWR